MAVHLQALDINNWKMEELQRMVDEFKENEIEERMLRKSTIPGMERTASEVPTKIIVRYFHE